MPPVRLDLGEGLLRQAWASDDALAMRLDPVKVCGIKERMAR